jgi:hypothetical protein
MLDDDDGGDRGFKWGRAIVGAILGFILAFIFVKGGESGFWWLIVPLSALAFGTGFKMPQWGFWDNQWDETREAKDAGATTTANDDKGGHGD